MTAGGETRGRVGRVFWIDPGGDGFPMSVIDAHPDVWQDKITGTKVNPNFKYRFLRVIEFPEISFEHQVHDSKY